MSMESDTTDLHLKSERKRKRKRKRNRNRNRKKLKSEPVRLTSVYPDDDMEEVDEEWNWEDYTYDDETYRKLDLSLSPYDAIPIPRKNQLCGSSLPIRPHPITERYRPYLKNLSEIALVYYQNNKGSCASFEFHDLVKCTFWNDNNLCARMNALHKERAEDVGYVKLHPCPPYPDYLVQPTDYYITFRAKPKAKGKAKGDPSNSLDITTFQAKVSVDEEEEDKSAVVKQCRIIKSNTLHHGVVVVTLSLNPIV